mgnify:FL=1
MTALLVLLISLTLAVFIIWWFFGKHQTETIASTQEGDMQKVEITVDGGYKPERVQLKVGVPAELTFIRKSTSGCFEEVLLPDFGKSAKLPVGKPYIIKIKPEKVGVFTYSCGMHMFFGKIEVTP